MLCVFVFCKNHTENLGASPAVSRAVLQFYSGGPDVRNGHPVLRDQNCDPQGERSSRPWQWLFRQLPMLRRQVTKSGVVDFKIILQICWSLGNSEAIFGVAFLFFCKLGYLLLSFRFNIRTNLYTMVLVLYYITPTWVGNLNMLILCDLLLFNTQCI